MDNVLSLTLSVMHDYVGPLRPYSLHELFTGNFAYDCIHASYIVTTNHTFSIAKQLLYQLAQ